MRDYLYKLKAFFLDLTRYPKPVYEEEFYDQYWESRKSGKMGIANNFQRQRANWIAQRLQNGENIIDIGCGDGAVLLHLKKKRNLNLTGLDISNDCLEFLQEQGISTLKLDTSKPEEIKDIPETDHFLLLEVIEHIPGPELLIKQLVKKTNKSIFISVPNTGYFKHRLRLLLGKFPLQWRVFPGEHVRFWTLKDFEWWAKTLDINAEVEVKAYQGIPYLNKLFPNLFGMGIIAQFKLK